MGGLNLKKDDLEFFRQNPGYGRVFEGILARYRSLGRLGGTVTLSNLTTVERQVLSNHLRRDLSKQKTVSFAVQEFSRSLEVTRFAHYSLEEILSSYFEFELTTAKEEAELFAEERREFLLSLAKQYEATIAGRWLGAIGERRAVGTLRILQTYGESPALLKEQIQIVARALNTLDERDVRYWRLPVFASLVTRDPHAFDHETALGRMLVDALCTVLGVEGYSSREEVGEVLYGAGLLVDEVSNFVTCSGLEGYLGSELHPVWAGATKCREPLQVPLLNLTQITRVKSPWNTVFVVENPAVFASILDAFSRGPLPPLICTAGQVKVAGLVLLKLLAQEHTTIFYSGDLDPEGILIAQRLAKRYPSLLNYWRFTPQDYERALSRKKLTSSRISKLDGVTDPKLKPLVQAVTKTKQAAYQELLLPDLIQDMEKL